MMALRPIQIDGDIAYVPLTKGYTAVIDAADVPLVARHCWAAFVRQNTVYAQRTERFGSGRRTVRMHRAIMGEPCGLEVDHRDGDGLNNRRGNLRCATHEENMRNQTLRSDSRSGVKGVFWSKPNRKWAARIYVAGRKHHLGYFADLDRAVEAYAKASTKLHGEFGRAA